MIPSICASRWAVVAARLCLFTEVTIDPWQSARRFRRQTFLSDTKVKKKKKGSIKKKSGRFFFSCRTTVDGGGGTAVCRRVIVCTGGTLIGGASFAERGLFVVRFFGCVGFKGVLVWDFRFLNHHGVLVCRSIYVRMYRV